MRKSGKFSELSRAELTSLIGGQCRFLADSGGTKEGIIEGVVADGLGWIYVKLPKRKFIALVAEAAFFWHEGDATIYFRVPFQGRGTIVPRQSASPQQEQADPPLVKFESEEFFI